jgi:transcriptional regulator with XRE-family HTH domain
MTASFFQELAERVQIHPDPTVLDYSLYVRLVRLKLHIGRKALARRANIDHNFIAFLENGLIAPGELTRAKRKKIQSVLGVPCKTFLRLNASAVGDLKMRWWQSLAEGENLIANSDWIGYTPKANASHRAKTERARM